MKAYTCGVRAAFIDPPEKCALYLNGNCADLKPCNAAEIEIIALDIDIDLGIEIEEGPDMDEAREYYTEKLGYDLGSKMESVIYDFKSTRKTGKLAPNIVKGIVDYWLKFSPQLLLEAKAVWDEKRYAEEGKDEKYFAGILRRLAKETDIRRASQVGAHK